MFISLQSRHLDDCTQYILMKIWENKLAGKTKCYQRLFVDYLRSVGLGNRGNYSSRALEEAYRFDHLNKVDIFGNECWDVRRRTNERYLDEVFEQVQEVLSKREDYL